MSVEETFSWQRPKSPQQAPRASRGTLRRNVLPGEIELDERESHYQEKIDEATARGDQSGQAEILRALALIHEAKGSLAKAESCLRSALEVDQTKAPTRRQAELRNDLGVVLARTNRPVDAIELHDQGLAICEGLDDIVGTTRGLRNKALALAARDEEASAMELWDRAFEEGRNADDATGNGHVLNNVAVTLMLRDEYDEAMGLLQRGVLLAQRGGDLRGLAKLYSNLGIIHYAQGDSVAAIPFLEMANGLLSGAVDRLAQLHILNNNILTYEKAYLEPARQFRRRFDDVLMGFQTRYPSRVGDSEVAAMRLGRDHTALLDELAEEWSVLSSPLLLRISSLSRTAAQL